MTRSPHQSGSAIILIFIAVAIFGALSFAVMRGGTGSMQTLTNEQARLAANEIIAYGDALAKTVQTLKLRGCADTQFDFANTVWTRQSGAVQIALGHNPNAPPSGCSVFSLTDGKIQPAIFPLSYTNNIVPGPTNTKLGHGRIYRGSVPGIGDASTQDLLYTASRLNQAVCLKINEILGVPNPDNQPPTFTHTVLDYNGSYSGTAAIVDTLGVFTGKSAFCATQLNGANYWRVLIAR